MNNIKNSTGGFSCRTSHFAELPMYLGVKFLPTRHWWLANVTQKQIWFVRSNVTDRWFAFPFSCFRWALHKTDIWDESTLVRKCSTWRFLLKSDGLARTWGKLHFKNASTLTSLQLLPCGISSVFVTSLIRRSHLGSYFLFITSSFRVFCPPSLRTLSNFVCGLCTVFSTGFLNQKNAYATSLGHNNIHVWKIMLDNFSFVVSNLRKVKRQRFLKKMFFLFTVLNLYNRKINKRCNIVLRRSWLSLQRKEVDFNVL